MVNCDATEEMQDFLGHQKLISVYNNVFFLTGCSDAENN